MAARYQLLPMICAATLLSALPARAECIVVTAKMVLEPASHELVFSGTVAAIDRTAELGLRITFDVDRVWKGTVAKRTELYLWELASEAPRFTVGRHYLAVARQVTDERERQGVGILDPKAVVFGPVQCSDQGLFVPGIIQDLGPGRPPGESRP